MKTFIKETPVIANGKSRSYWQWKETCDECGALITGKNWRRLDPPDLNKRDLCNECFKKELDIKVKEYVKNNMGKW